MKKKEKTEKSKFDIEEPLKNVNRFLQRGFKDYIKDKPVNNQKDFDKYLNDYKGVN